MSIYSIVNYNNALCLQDPIFIQFFSMNLIRVENFET